MYKQQFPMFNSIWPIIGLGSFLYSGIQFFSLNCYCLAGTPVLETTMENGRPVCYTQSQHWIIH